MKKILLLFLLLTASLQGFCQKSEEIYKKYGTFLRLHLPNTAFPHSSRANGYSYSDKQYSAEKHYQDSTVLVFIPKNFKPSKKIDLVFYFHGWFCNVDSALEQFHLIEQFVQSEKNAILVLPELARNAPDSRGGKLEEANTFKSLTDSVMMYLNRVEALQKSRLGNAILAGHSGAYRTISYIIFHGGLPISEVYLFDGLYGNFQKYAVWLLKNPKARFINFYSEQSIDVKNNSEQMIEEMRVWGIDHLKSSDKNLSLKDLETKKVSFIKSDLDHYQIVYLNGAFYKCLLSSSRLKN